MYDPETKFKYYTAIYEESLKEEQTKTRFVFIGILLFLGILDIFEHQSNVFVLFSNTFPLGLGFTNSYSVRYH